MTELSTELLAHRRFCPVQSPLRILIVGFAAQHVLEPALGIGELSVFPVVFSQLIQLGDIGAFAGVLR